ncbi:hypothetical protein Patl1_05622 [Pistacia atlantica]|uniref:Uncharacterized protein n=1 Tax=Pistacia atlantica TaxID=434234 RepID=A0ACC1BTW3_9ROSI|nr:hypothetical protein Patl1_05622 [Pistacia atlantica]
MTIMKRTLRSFLTFLRIHLLPFIVSKEKQLMKIQNCV